MAIAKITKPSLNPSVNTTTKEPLKTTGKDCWLHQETSLKPSPNHNLPRTPPCVTQIPMLATQKIIKLKTTTYNYKNKNKHNISSELRLLRKFFHTQYLYTQTWWLVPTMDVWIPWAMFLVPILTLRRLVGPFLDIWEDAQGWPVVFVMCGCRIYHHLTCWGVWLDEHKHLGNVHSADTRALPSIGLECAIFRTVLWFGTTYWTDIHIVWGLYIPCVWPRLHPLGT